MTHIDTWLDDPTTGPPELKEWFEHFRRPAYRQDRKWLASRKLICTYKDGKRYRCTGCSCLGDVWLAADHTREFGYDLRVDLNDCTNWEIT